MPVGLAADVEPVGIGKLRGIAVGGADAQMHVGVREQAFVEALEIESRGDCTLLRRR
jgi:hypothetical protein